jgi:hypothetical protein
MEAFRARGKIVEEEFAKNLKDPKWSNDNENFTEHWDIEGVLEDKSFKFDVKDLKKFNRKDSRPQDKMACVEYVGVGGYPGWVQGKADYIAFKREKYSWLVVNRQALWDMLKVKLEEREYSPTKRQWYEEKEPYATYDRSFFDKKDKFCWVPFEDIEKLEHKKIT